MAENQMKPSYRQLLFSNGGHTRAYEGPFNRGQDTRLHPIIPQGTQRHTRACEGPFIPPQISTADRTHAFIPPGTHAGL